MHVEQITSREDLAAVASSKRMRPGYCPTAMLFGAESGPIGGKAFSDGDLPSGFTGVVEIGDFVTIIDGPLGDSFGALGAVTADDQVFAGFQSRQHISGIDQRDGAYRA